MSFTNQESIIDISNEIGGITFLFIWEVKTIDSLGQIRYQLISDRVISYEKFQGFIVSIFLSLIYVL
jgi:hypothetical protein